jgi:hypothetical protein
MRHRKRDATVDLVLSDDPSTLDAMNVKSAVELLTVTLGDFDPPTQRRVLDLRYAALTGHEPVVRIALDAEGALVTPYGAVLQALDGLDARVQETAVNLRSHELRGMPPHEPKLPLASQRGTAFAQSVSALAVRGMFDAGTAVDVLGQRFRVRRREDGLRAYRGYANPERNDRTQSLVQPLEQLREFGAMARFGATLDWDNPRQRPVRVPTMALVQQRVDPDSGHPFVVLYATVPTGNPDDCWEVAIAVDGVAGQDLLDDFRRNPDQAVRDWLGGDDSGIPVEESGPYIGFEWDERFESVLESFRASGVADTRADATELAETRKMLGKLAGQLAPLAIVPTAELEL